MDKEQALIILKELYKDAFFSVRTALETLIPEIKEEAEDERIRKELIEHCKNQAKPYIDTGNECPQIQSWIAWLEKQGDQKSTNNVEPRFHKGQWIACRGLNTAFIVNIDNDRYEVEFIDGSKGFPHIDYVDRFFHLWTIQDAKDGDIIYIKRYRTNDEWLLIFKKIEGKNNFIDVYDYYAFCITSDNIYHESIGSGCWGGLLANNNNNNDIVCPATKEQRDLLFSKIHSTGYEWNEKEKVIVPLLKLKSEETDGEPN